MTAILVQNDYKIVLAYFKSAYRTGPLFIQNFESLTISVVFIL